MTDLATIVDPHTLVLVRRLPGPIERVWKYISDPTSLVKWFSDGVVSDQVGGIVDFEMGATGRVTVYEPPRVLEYTWNELELSRGALVDSLVRWELTEEGDRVRLTLTHSRLSEREVVLHGAGWHTFLHRLIACLEGREPEDIWELFTRFKAVYEKRGLHVS